MQKNVDGSVMLTKTEFAKLNKAYQGLYSMLDSISCSVNEYFERKDYMNIAKWQCWLNGEEFDRSDYE